MTRGHCFVLLLVVLKVSAGTLSESLNEARQGDTTNHRLLAMLEDAKAKQCVDLPQAMITATVERLTQVVTQYARDHTVIPLATSIVTCTGPSGAQVSVLAEYVAKLCDPGGNDLVVTCDSTKAMTAEQLAMFKDEIRNPNQPHFFVVVALRSGKDGTKPACACA